MSIRVYIGLFFFISCLYIYAAQWAQSQAEVVYYDKTYFSEARAFTGRRSRKDSYRTNITVTSRYESNNNVTMKIIGDVKTVGSTIFHENKICESYKLPWIKQFFDSYSNITSCPVPAGTYKTSNLELPPKNFPLPLPKGEGTLHMKLYSDNNTHLILHFKMKLNNLK